MPTAPTLVAAAFATATSGTSATTASISWQTGDVVTVIYGNEGVTSTNTGPSTTGSGLSFTVDQNHNSAGSDCGAFIARAIATASSSGTITAGANASQHHFVGVLVERGSAGIGNSAMSTGAPRTVSLTPTAADSSVHWGVFDWAAVATVAPTPTPTSHSSASPGPSATPQAARVTGFYTYYWQELDDQTSAGAVSYGIGGTGTGPFTIVALEVKGAASGAGVTLGEAAETDTAQPLTLAKAATLGEAIETDTAQPLALSKVAALGESAETDTAQPLILAKAAVLGEAIETDTGQPLALSKVVTLGEAAETDTARPISLSKAVTLGQAVETDTAFAVSTSGSGGTTLGQAVETDTARPLALAKAATLGRPIEADTAQALSLSKARATGQPVETDTARALTFTKIIRLGLAVETDTAAALTLSGARGLGGQFRGASGALRGEVDAAGVRSLRGAGQSPGALRGEVDALSVPGLRGSIT